MKYDITKIIIGLLVIAHMSVAAPQENELKKVFHHTTPAGKAGDSLALGDLSLLFTREPQVTQHSKKEVEGKEIVQYFFPLTYSSSLESTGMIERVNGLKGAGYSINITSVTLPLKGLMVTLSYDPEKVGVSYYHFDTIKSEKAFVFHFYNKNIVQDLKKPDPMIRLAQHAHTPCIVIDAGHGGHDTGTLGCGIALEKDITLAISKEVASCLKKKAIALS